MTEKSLQKQEREDEGANPYSLEKVLGVAVAGAVLSLALYSLYHQLSEESRESIRETLLQGFKAALRSTRGTE